MNFILLHYIFTLKQVIQQHIYVFPIYFDNTLDLKKWRNESFSQNVSNFVSLSLIFHNRCYPKMQYQRSLIQALCVFQNKSSLF